jgi:DNA ligase-1
MLAKNYDPAKPEQYKGWLMSEKLDGVRCFWNGTTLYSRNGNKFYAPDWFKKDLPANLALDGELWTKRDDFQKCVSIVKTQDTKNEKWRDIIYKVYDAPLLVNHTFKERLEVMDQVIKPLNAKYVQVHKQVICEGP